MGSGILGVRQPLVLSPMVDVTDAAFRSMARDAGADVTCSEMVAAVGLVRGGRKSWAHVTPWPGESPYGVQFMCGDPEEMRQAVTTLATRVRPDFVDVNLGCPAPNIMKVCAGGFLMRDPAKAGAVVRAARAAADEAGIQHVSAKMRLGPSESRMTYVEVAKACEDAGASWLTLHARTIEQGYSGAARWEHIRTLVGAVGVPVIGNGDLREPEDVLRMRDETGCAGFFVARAAMRDPTVFARMKEALRDGTPGPAASLHDRLELALEYIARAKALGIADPSTLRRQAHRFVAGCSGAKRLRVVLQEPRSAEALEQVLRAEVEKAALVAV